MAELRIVGLDEVERYIDDCPLASKKQQIRLLFGSARRIRKDVQDKMREAAPVGGATHFTFAGKRGRTRRRKKRRKDRLRSLRIWIPKGGDFDYPEFRIVGPRHLVPQNALTGFLRLDDVGVELGREAEKQLRNWIRKGAQRPGRLPSQRRRHGRS